MQNIDLKVESLMCSTFPGMNSGSGTCVSKRKRAIKEAIQMKTYTRIHTFVVLH